MERVGFGVRASDSWWRRVRWRRFRAQGFSSLTVPRFRGRAAPSRLGAAQRPGTEAPSRSPAALRSVSAPAASALRLAAAAMFWAETAAALLAEATEALPALLLLPPLQQSETRVTGLMFGNENYLRQVFFFFKSKTTLSGLISLPPLFCAIRQFP